MEALPASLSGPHPGNSPLPPSRRPQSWGTQFSFLFLVLLLLLGGAATVFGANADETDFFKASFGLNTVLIAVCIAGVCLAPNTLMRVGFLLFALAARNVLFASGVFLGGLDTIDTPGAIANVTLAVFDPVYYPFLTGVLSLPGLICLSYGEARWQRSDALFIWIQLVLTLGLGFVLLELPYLPDDLFPQLPGYVLPALVSDSTLFLALAGIACFLLRPACWKASPLVVLYLSVGQGLFLLGGGVLFLLYNSPFPWVLNLGAFWILGFRIVCGANLAGEALLIPGLVLLIWRARGQDLA